MNENRFELTSGNLNQMILQIAAKHGAEIAEIEHELRVAMMHMMFSPDPLIQKQWESIPHKGKLPSPEEFIAWAAEKTLSQI